MEILKYCRACAETKSIELFNKQSSSKDGFKYECRKCAAARNKKLYQNKTPEELAAYKESVVQWQKDNPDDFSAAQSRYRESKKVNQ